MGCTSEFVAMRKDKSLLPVRLTVSHLTGVGEDSVFMGVIEVRGGAVRAGWQGQIGNSKVCRYGVRPFESPQAVPVSKDMASIWLLPNGRIVGIDPALQ